MVFDDAIRSGLLSQSDLAVVEYIHQYPHRVVRMNSRELAEATFVSQSTVTRLCKKAGFASFGDMRVALVRELADEESYQRVDSDFPQLSGASEARVIATISSMERESVRKTERLLAAVDWEPMLCALEEATGITLYAAGSSRTACLGFAEKLQRIGKNVTMASEHYALAGQWAGTCPRGELSMLISYSGEGNHAEHPARVLARRGLKSISVTSDTENTLRRLTTWHVPVALTERRFMSTRIAPFQSTVATTYALDTLYALLFARNYTRNARLLSRALEMQGTNVRLAGDGTVSMVMPESLEGVERLESH